MKHKMSAPSVRFVLVAALLFMLAGLAPTSALAEGNPSYAVLTNGDVTAAAYTQPTTNVSANVIYIVKRGDTLAKIAARYGVTVAAILRANPSIHNPDRIYVGQRLVIPTGSTGGGATVSQVYVYLIATETGGPVGCGDSAVAVRRNIPATRAPLTAALNELLSLHDEYYGQSGLRNALWQSNLSVQRITQSGTTWNIYLRGTLQLGGTCDSPRVEAQLLRTALQFSTVKRANFFINGVPLKTALSQK